MNDSVWSIALALFIVANPYGNIPALVSLVKDFSFERQQKILFREAIFSFLVALFFLYAGKPFLETIHIDLYAVNISGGTLLFLVALEMIFPPTHTETTQHTLQEPFLVPIATPLISGGGVLTSILFYSAKEKDNLKVTLAAAIAWIAVTLIVVSSAYLNRLLGRRGLLALEQLMGMVLAMISMEIIVKGAILFMNTLDK